MNKYMVFRGEHLTVFKHNGEVAGVMKGFNYGLSPGTIKFYAFDILKNNEFLNPDEFISTCDTYNINRVPVLNIEHPFDFNEICEMANGQDLLGNHIREGVVVKPMRERVGKCGRVCLKVVGEDYLTSK